MWTSARPRSRRPKSTANQKPPNHKVTPVHSARNRRRTVRQDRAPLAPTAEAGKVLAMDGETAEGEVVNFSMVQGENKDYVGGVTTARGSSKRVRRLPTGGAALAADDTSRGGRRGTRDRSNPARPRGSAWSCSHLFPAAANEADVHHAVVTVVVAVSSSGRATAVNVVQDPGYGFGAAAKSCAMAQSYQAANDHAGTAVHGLTAPFSVRFTR